MDTITINHNPCNHTHPISHPDKSKLNFQLIFSSKGDNDQSDDLFVDGIYDEGINCNFNSFNSKCNEKQIVEMIKPIVKLKEQPLINSLSSFSQFQPILDDDEIKDQNSSYINHIDNKNDIRGPYLVNDRVEILSKAWNGVLPIHPVQFLLNILTSRGYNIDFIDACSSLDRCSISRKQVDDYDIALADAVRNSDIKQMEYMKSIGKSLTACNRYSESILHLACRRSSFEMVKWMLDNGSNLLIVDDYGRTPLHDACWRSELKFDIITLLLDRNISLMYKRDVRGSLPLHYARQDDWLKWCAYLFHQKEKYWEVMDMKLRQVEESLREKDVDFHEALKSEDISQPIYLRVSDSIVEKLMQPKIKEKDSKRKMKTLNAINDTENANNLESGGYILRKRKSADSLVN